jgi:hypothetical protein
MGDSYYHYTITGNNMEEIRNTQYVRWGSEVGECFTSFLVLEALLFYILFTPVLMMPLFFLNQGRRRP